ncbi:MAG: hypothetical protein ACJAU6_003697 [Alphaproteobacteria bacterium]|jgi:hypothetical protein
MWRQVWHIGAASLRIELPTVIDATDTITLIPAKKQRGATMRASMVHHADIARLIAKRDQFFPQQFQSHRIPTRQDLRRDCSGHLIFAH